VEESAILRAVKKTVRPLIHKPKPPKRTHPRFNKTSPSVPTEHTDIFSATSVEQASTRSQPLQFDPHNYHAAINRHNLPSDTNIHETLAAMFCGTKRVSWLSEDVLRKITQAEWLQMKQHGIVYHIIETNQDYNELIMYIQTATDRANMLQDTIETSAVYKYLLDDLEREKDPAKQILIQEDIQNLKNSIPVNNAYLIGKLLDYPEDDVQFFYERNLGIYLGSDLNSALAEFEQDKQEANAYCLSKNIIL
jgi:hypothetical protein